MIDSCRGHGSWRRVFRASTTVVPALVFATSVAASVVTIVVTSVVTRVANSQTACNRARADSLTAEGWRALRVPAPRAADSAFVLAGAACPGDAAATIGRGYVALREERTTDARTIFEAALRRLPDSYDALTGLGLAAWRTADLASRTP